MAVCDFCSVTYFKTEWMPSKKPRRQDRDLQSWMSSLRTACTMCTLLFEQYKTAVQQVQRQDNGIPTVKAPALSDEDAKKKRAALWKIDEHIRSTSVEGLLLEWATKEANEIESTFQLPVYDVMLQEAGDETVWHLDFRPLAPSTGITLTLPKQRFIVHDLRCRCRFWCVHEVWLIMWYSRWRASAKVGPISKDRQLRTSQKVGFRLPVRQTSIV